MGATSELVLKSDHPGREPPDPERVDTFDATFVEAPRLHPIARVWRKPDRTSDPHHVFADIDDYMRTTMEHYGVRHAQFAVSYHGALKYAATYNHVEPGSHHATNDHRFRIGSCTKTITAVAFFSLWQDEVTPELLLTGVHQILGPDAPIPLFNSLGRPPKNHQFGELVIDHLLLHLGGFSAAAATDDVAILRNIQKLRAQPGAPLDSPQLSTQLPIDTARMVAYVCDLEAKAFARPVGQKFSYSNIGFFLLGRVVHALAFKKDPSIINYRDVVARMYARLRVDAKRVQLSPDSVDRSREPVYQSAFPL